MKISELSIAAAAQQLALREISAEELTNACLERIADVDPKLDAFITITKDTAQEQARAIDTARARGDELGPLAGIPAAIKDNILIKGVRATAGSEILATYTATYDATVVTKLRAAGAVFLGKTNMDEFAMGSSTENSAFKKSKNPWNTGMVPGGSSGGSAVAVAANECLFALGSDTGGSIRQPAALTGVVGLKPTYGSVSRSGLIAMASSFDIIGPLTKTVTDAALVYHAIKGQDVRDATSFVKQDAQDVRAHSVKGMRIGIPKEYFIAGLDKNVDTVVRQAIGILTDLGAEMVEVTLPHTEYGLPVYYILMAAEVSANLSRFDGIRYGYSALRDMPDEVKTLYEVYAKTRARGFGSEAKRRIMLGTYTLSKGYYDAYYKRAAKVRTLMARDFDTAFLTVDCVLSPTSPTVAWPFGAKTEDPLTMYLSDVFTVSANIAGIPALSVPCGFVDNLPVGFQLMAPLYREDILFCVGAAYEEATAGNVRSPAI